VGARRVDARVTCGRVGARTPRGGAARRRSDTAGRGAWVPGHRVSVSVREHRGWRGAWVPGRRVGVSAQNTAVARCVGARRREGCEGEVTLAVFASFPYVFLNFLFLLQLIVYYLALFDLFSIKKHPRGKPRGHLYQYLNLSESVDICLYVLDHLCLDVLLIISQEALGSVKASRSILVEESERVRKLLVTVELDCSCDRVDN